MKPDQFNSSRNAEEGNSGEVREAMSVQGMLERRRRSRQVLLGKMSDGGLEGAPGARSGTAGDMPGVRAAAAEEARPAAEGELIA
jgi:hypothetical protein